jgi:adenine-specific DNA-methyltransferase
MKEGFSIYNLVFSFYNSLTFCLAELEGRFYGGGVLELIPSEFKNLKIPFIKVTKKQFEKLDEMFRTKNSIEDILNYTDPIVLKGIDKTTVKKLKKIRAVLLSRRIKRK